MSKLLVTGAAGFMGANFIHYWHNANPDDTLVALDSLTYAGNRNNLQGALDAPWFTFIEGSITDQALVETLLHDHAIDTLVHFAAESHVDRSITGPDAFIETNIVGTHTLLKAAKNCWLQSDATRNNHFHHVSTDEVYGTLLATDPAFSETTPYAPNSPYAASKAASDHLVRAWHHTFGLQVTTSNCSNNLGPYQYPEKLIPLFLLNALHGRAMPIYGDGMNVRDWLFVTDHCSALAACLERGVPGEVYAIGGGAELPNIAVVDAICAEVDAAFTEDSVLAARFPDAPAAKGQPTASLKSFVEDRKGHDRRYAINAAKAKAELGFTPAHSFEDALRQTLRWYLANAAWWRPLLPEA